MELPPARLPAGPPSLRLLPWAPQYGTSMLADVDAPAPRLEVDTAVEHGRWVSVRPDSDAPSAVQLVDGVRRVEAHAFADAPSVDGEPCEPMFGLFGSYAVGAVRCEDGRAWFLDDAFRLERRYFQAGGVAEDHVVPGASALRFVAEQRPESSANGLIDALNRSMLDCEAALAESLAMDESALTLVDGPLRHLRAPGRRVAGYVKRVVHWYVSPVEQRLLLTLRSGERTPLFRLTDPDDPASPGRLCWYVRIAELPANYHPLSGIMRLETPGALPLAQAVRLADQATVVLPRMASSMARDPRAPQNLVPVGALEAYLTHRLGDRELVRRALTAHLALRGGSGIVTTVAADARSVVGAGAEGRA